MNELVAVAVSAALVPVAILAHEGTHALAARVFGLPARLGWVGFRPVVVVPSGGIPEAWFRVVCLAPSLAACGVVAALDTLGVPVGSALAGASLRAYAWLLAPSVSGVSDVFVFVAGVMYAAPSVYDLAPRRVAAWKQRRAAPAE